jgi:hypothetical protein
MSQAQDYVVLIIGDDTRWSRMSEVELAAGMTAHEAFSAALAQRGHTVTGGAELHYSTDAKVVPAGVAKVAAASASALAEALRASASRISELWRPWASVSTR